ATPSPAGADDATLVAFLTGAAERPGPGDPDAFGQATITINDAANQLCLALTWTAVDGTPSGLHIHVAPPTAPGPIVVPFATPGSTPFSQCVIVGDEALLDNIAANPLQYYINLHSVPLYPGGAIRGQLQFPPGDVTPPTCFVSGLFAGPPRQQEVTVQDTGSGLFAVINVQIVNGTVNVQPFAPGSTTPVRVTATKSNPAFPTVWRFDAVDAAGNVRHCA
ncbi:MAG TPA: CHRD domain-containing protein, partial [Acidimicrobiales bacterium]|nr:CHRD domain-containing protein [Acidimicrobiales bacterium]